LHTVDQTALLVEIPGYHVPAEVVMAWVVLCRSELQLCDDELSFDAGDCDADDVEI
jgi:hypothetical protein